MPLRRLTSYSLRTKLFFSHLLVALIVTFTFVAAAFAVPTLLERQPFVAAGLADLVTASFGRAFLYLTLATILAVVVAAVASLFVAGRITTPVHRMLAATRRVSAGRYEERVPISEEDELGELSRGFNAMAAALEEGERQRREFIADVSHELGTPLSTLQGYMEGLMDGVIEPSEETWGILYSETERMRRLVNDLRQLSRVEAGQLELNIGPAAPAALVRLATESMQPLFTEKGVQLESRLPPDLPPVSADPDRLVQVLTNLLNNALRHTPPGGRVTVEAERQPGRVLLSVRDTGAGIAREHLPHLFERFYRVEKSRSRAGGGSGVGLAISRALVEAMGGAIWAESAGKGEGATFRLTLPVADS
ncbi:sensor histidine kinase [Rubrobacter taiwanensis]|jgi:two-component system sensor histidine kinase BaeS|nr:ATP-binding protein [Rubrobacter taiwanensis]